MGYAQVANSGKFFKSYAAVAHTSITAAGAGDNSAITGATIDRRLTGGGLIPSGKLVISYKTTLASSQTLKFAVEYQESADNSTWDTAVAIQASTTAATGAVTNGVGTVELNIDLEGVGTATASRAVGKRYVRFNMTPDLSAAGTDTAIVSAVFVASGMDLLPPA